MWRLRGHHICCIPYFGQSFPERGDAFLKRDAEAKRALASDHETITLAEGPDDICETCTNLVNGGCVSPKGDETATRKWDGILAGELGVSPGTCLSSKEWRELVESKSPFKLCRRCQWRQTCKMGQRL